MLITQSSMKELLLVRFNPGDDLLESLRKVVKERNIRSAVILSGVGSVVSHHFHVIASMENPPKEYFTKGESAADILHITGAVMEGRVHAHVTFSNEKVAYGGHLELGCKILTFAMVTLAEIDTDLAKWDSIGAIEDLLA